MKILLSILLLSFILISVPLSAQVEKLQGQKGESTITYKLTHPLHEIEAVSKYPYCEAMVDKKSKKIESAFVQVDVTTFDSGNSGRDSHAMEVIDALTYPDAKFTSTQVVQNGDSLKIKGNLTFHGVTKEIYIPAYAKWTDGKLTVTGNFTISLTAYKIERPKLLLIPVDDKLTFLFKEVFNI